ncbi:SDR family oxidoreductase [Nonomuraea sp. SMC257]|uniref:SDR family oxidoreductase n=1 Tax=Nonomuraea montanisoli TaxID=2741721 RepID=A0A7Y6I5V3_9ACTN|nr:SDR family oxidoreductase [Nonomuraea montanisoli]NUW32129.1 SDR family oxidoreductase [Nonomuraea montanisoli]
MKVLITGGASGLGRATAEAVAKEGWRPLVVDARDPGQDVEHVVADLADRAEAERAVRELAERAGGLDAVVTAAGVDACGRLEDVPADAWDRVIMVNLLGTASVVRAALPYLKESRGKVVTCASTLGLRPLSDASAYCASKFGVVGFTRALAVELAGQVGVTLLVPGGMRTAFFDGRPEQYKPGPDASLNDPADVARTVVFALGQPAGCELRELVVCPSTETSWP